MSDSPVSLSEVSPGESASVVAMDPSIAGMQRLQEMGLLPGTAVKVVRRAPLGDPIELEVRGYKLSIRKAEAAGISVRPA